MTPKLELYSAENIHLQEFEKSKWDMINQLWEAEFDKGVIMQFRCF